ncbi:MAG: DUF3223 domain-containing protein [Undibacterium sp.]|uniref:DUF3223 domain-containing protein n=1 Tax=Undibacterium sp. TaxID=1914977 RepID=UPI002715D4A1|nr:DUF3223 domain-containing protein [Undibacterium sp.]MDO8653310.1 DUF3223 domain-containing protein [Undibacterium sp.]
MGNAIPVKIADEFFKKKGDLVEKIQLLISKYAPMAYLLEVDEQFCAELFKFHPNYIEHIGSGLKRIQVRLDEYGNKCFHIHCTDGSDDVISWKKCVRNAK